MGIPTMKAIAIAASVVFFLSLAGSVSPQQGAALSLERCRSDLANWTHDFSYFDTAREDQLLTYDELKTRIDEAGGCRNWDSNEPYYSAAATVQARYSALIRDRLYDFLVRHQMAGQFEKEDANGLR
jgi:hypothetical protein